MEEKQVIFQQVTVQRAGISVLQNISFVIHNKEQWAIIGSSGSGKTTLAHALAGKIFFRGNIDFFSPSGKSLVLVEQQHRFKDLFHTEDFYYQQRFNSCDAENSLTVAEVLVGKSKNAYWLNLLHISPLLEKPLIQLSSGENKRLQIAIALLENPAFLVLDNPFVGLDTEGRITLNNIINAITSDGVIIILICSPEDLPDSITHVAVLEKGQLVSAGSKQNYLELTGKPKNIQNWGDSLTISNLPNSGDTENFDLAVKMENVTIRYGDKIILDDINWEVRRGERWNVAGPNGAGKSTLLSLITADNPQSYANNIHLFDKKRGTGESIWDIKRKIGFVSAELHLFFDQSSSVFEVVGSGLFDTIGLFRKVSPQNEEQIMMWLGLLGLENVRDQPLRQLSTGQQRRVLLVRALIKNPALLVLDEPCQGLDIEQTSFFTQLIDHICAQFNTTLIYVSHYRKDIPSCIDHFLLLEKGVITEKV